ncbi:BnaC08g09420D [Brassica napus]|uniref:peroxidase n=1 Tax=Brassica napus TaxID=3708 RepID=A0A078FK02_BRANA|nr:BnaC08g09420D [Brassica napus]
MKLTVVSAVILVVVFVAWPVSAGGSGHEEEEDDTKSWFPLDNLLSLNYYDKSCPNFEKIVDTKVRQWTKSDPSLGPALLRLLFHDCGVTGVQRPNGRDVKSAVAGARSRDGGHLSRGPPDHEARYPLRHLPTRRHFSLTDSTSSTLSSFPGPTPSEKHTVEPSNRGFTTSTQHMELIRPLILNSQIT